MTELPAGTVTFLFTDIEGSTRLWQEYPVAMQPALARHDAIVRDAIEAHGGHVVKTTGDGAHAAFATASDAIDAAIAAQLALSAEGWELPEQLRVRMGIHSGPAELRDGDYYGTAVNRAARIASVAHGGQIVVSLAAEQLARDGVVELVDLGEHRLRDLGQPERIYQVVHAGLDREFPSLRSLDTFTTNLPPQRTSFVGRDAELSAVKDALSASRLVTLTGVGGVGKTRLAVQVAADMISEFPDGVWLVELAAVGEPDAVPDVLATTLGLVPQSGMTMTASIAETLAVRRSLVVLDNCEHVLDAAALLVEAILARPGPAKVLATSREGLGVADERLWPVPSLGGRDGGGSEAIELFVERARAAVPDFDADAVPTAEAVREICRRLDGIPLAIELAAARAISMSAPELRDRLDDRFRLLAGSRRGLERHQTLRHAVQWSYDLLDDDERTLLNRCAVFAGGFDLAGAVAVGGEGVRDEYEVLDMLDALVRKSLVDADRASGRTRYSLLETIRQFAEEQLAGTADITAVRELHAAYYAAQADETIALWDGPRQRETFDWVDRELPNLRAAFRTATDHGALDVAATIAVVVAALGWFVEAYEPVAWAEELIDAARAADHPQLMTLNTLASLCTSAGRVEDAMRYCANAKALLGDARYEALPFGLAATVVGPAYVYAGRPDEWVDFCRAEIARSPSPPLMARVCLVTALALASRYDEATALAGSTLEAGEAGLNAHLLAGALSSYAFAFFDRDPPAALAAMRRAMAVAHESGSRTMQTHGASTIARVEAAHGDPRRALEYCKQAILGYDAAGDRASMTMPLVVLVSLLHRIGRDEPAAILAGFGADTFLSSVPELAASLEHLRETLGAETFESLAHQGRTMERVAMVRYAVEQIDAAYENF